jgi:hypothetical protein
MQYYYIVFDMTPLDERSEHFLQIGIAPRNPRNLIYEQGGFDDRDTPWKPDDIDNSQENP